MLGMGVLGVLIIVQLYKDLQGIMLVNIPTPRLG